MKDIFVPYRVGFVLLLRETVGSICFYVAQLVFLWGLAYWAFASFRPLSGPIGWSLVVIALLAAGYRTVFIGMVAFVWYNFYGKFPTTKTVFTTSGIYLENEHGTNRVAWESINKVTSSARCYTLLYGKNERLFVPIQVLRDNDRLTEFTELLNNKTELDVANLESLDGAKPTSKLLLNKPWE